MSAPEDKQRDREIAANEAERQMVGSARVSIWAIAVAVIATAIVAGIVWAWVSR